MRAFQFYSQILVGPLLSVWSDLTGTDDLREPSPRYKKPSTTTTTTIFIRAQKLYSIDLNIRQKNYKGKEHSHLRIAELIGQAERNLQIHLLNIEQWTRLPSTHTLAHTNNNRQGDVHTQKLENKVHQ